jgi:hypothetical protein
MQFGRFTKRAMDHAVCRVDSFSQTWHEHASAFAKRSLCEINRDQARCDFRYGICVSRSTSKARNGLPFTCSHSRDLILALGFIHHDHRSTTLRASYSWRSRFLIVLKWGLIPWSTFPLFSVLEATLLSNVSLNVCLYSTFTLSAPRMNAKRRVKLRRDPVMDKGHRSE